MQKTPAAVASLSPFRHILAQSPLRFAQLTISGDDAVGFIQGQSTQSISSEWRLHAFLDRTGKIESYFLLWTHDKEATLLVHEALLAAVQQRFERYVISEDVIVSAPKSSIWWLITGSEHGSGIPGTLRQQRAWLSPEALADIPKASENDLACYLRWQGVADLTEASHVGELINQSILFESAVDLKKGCFPGQEVVAKIHHNRGAAWSPVLLKKKTSGQAPAQIVVDDKVVAKIHSTSDGEWYRADVLRDVRVEGMVLAGDFVVQLYPRWPMDQLGRAMELFHLGSEAFGRGEETLAQQCWQLAIEIDASCADAYEAMGVSLGRQERFVEAEQWMRRLLEVEPTSVMAHTNLSLFLMRQNRIQEAEDHKSKATVAQFAVFGKKAAQDRADKEAKEKAEAGRQQREKMFQEVLGIDPEDALANYGLGTIALERGEFEKARQYLTQVLASDANYAVAYLALGKAYQALQMNNEAKQTWESGIKIAAKKGEMMPANEMQTLLVSLE